MSNNNNNHHHFNQSDRSSIENFFNNPTIQQHFESFPRSRRNMYEPSSQQQQQPAAAATGAPADFAPNQHDPMLNHRAPFDHHFGDDHEFPFHGPNSLRQRFKDRFFQGHDYHDGPGFHDASNVNDPASGQQPQSNRPEPRVYNIPIKVEPRIGGSSRDASPKPPNFNHPTEPLVGQQHFPEQQQQRQSPQSMPFRNPYANQNQPTQVPISNQQPAANGGPPPARVVPIQITKSSSTPLTTAQQQRQPKMEQEQHQQKINESLSDAAIADPNQVYPMSYDPPSNLKVDDINVKIPDVVAMSYEPPVVKKQSSNLANSQAQPNQEAAVTGHNTDSNSKTVGPTIVQYQGDERQNNSEKPEQPDQKQETPYDYVKEILDDLGVWEAQVNECQATSPEDKGYKWLDEMLTLCVLRLDCINIDGDEGLRKYRKQAINEVNRVVSLLESKLRPKDGEDRQTNNDHNDDQTPPAPPSSYNDEPKTKDSKKKDSKKKDGGKFLSFFKNNKQQNTNNDDGNPPKTDTDSNNNDLKSTELQQGGVPNQNNITGAINNNHNNQSAIIGRETEV